ncbi:MAG: protein-ADP-ribose hydrolase [Coriobacteriia bacterium]|nr:protein-ADP-ribose hydrolase [Coriobacteriia bacterium]
MEKTVKTQPTMTDDELLSKLRFCVRCLMAERPNDDARQLLNELNTMEFSMVWTMFRALVNTREPVAADSDLLRIQDEVLQELIARDGVEDAANFVSTPYDDRISLWMGDITRLRADAVVNAANSAMTGCWQPGHHCIDNAIHTFAGIQLRMECARIMAEQGSEEPTGKAKVTGAYNLPATYVIHTVGPIANGRPTDLHRRQLASSYESCLEAARSLGVRSLAFCCVSTGVFGFPQEEAAKLAVATVRNWLQVHATTDLNVIFNVFTQDDLEYYQRALSTWA